MGPTTAPAVTPEDIHSVSQKQDKVRSVLSILKPRQAQFLLLRSHDFTYQEVASILDVNPASIGTLVSRAEESFRKEYIKRYGHE
jgi:RNA polymerase sigma-70 factor, ECF subfamily